MNTQAYNKSLQLIPVVYYYNPYENRLYIYKCNN